MSKLVEHKEMIHVGAEVVLFAGITYYVYSKTSKLSASMEALTKEVAEQKERIIKHETIINSMISQIEKLHEYVQAVDRNKESVRVSAHVATPVSAHVAAPSPRRRQNSPIRISKPSQAPVARFEELPSDDSEGSDIDDDEITDELHELQSKA
jgi:hypothetical protein